MVEIMQGNAWTAPEKFDPSRFLDADGNLMKHENFIPFCLGKRVCLGESLAKSELFLFFTGLLQNFKLEPASEEEILTEKRQPGIVSAPWPFTTKIVSRL